MNKLQIIINKVLNEDNSSIGVFGINSISVDNNLSKSPTSFKNTPIPWDYAASKSANALSSKKNKKKKPVIQRRPLKKMSKTL